MRWRLSLRLGAAAIAMGLLVAIARVHAAPDLERARFWTIPPDDYRVPNGDAPFPEDGLLPADRDIGLAFSGGGVRSASETLGELRGLREIGMLDRVRYTSAVSGGAWATLPWTFSGEPELLGDYVPPDKLQYAQVTAFPMGSLAGALTDVYLRNDALKEIGLDVWYYNVEENARQLQQAVRSLLGEAPTPDRTYATLLGNNLIGRLVHGANVNAFAWTAAQAEENSRHRRETTLPYPGRPFPIASAAILTVNRDIPYPSGTPIEFTPLYIGARQQIGGRLGGAYLWPAAYNATAARVNPRETGYVQFTHDAAHPPLTLADVAASTGAAPLFFLAGGNGATVALQDFIRSKAAAYFPSFTHLAFRGVDFVQPHATFFHADGGARDNLGVAPLLARHVRKIVAFVNVDKPDFNNVTDISALFVAGAASNTGDQRDLVVFDGGEPAYRAIMDDFASARAEHRPLVSCRTLDVIGNRLFNIRPYSGVVVCWVFPDRSTDWIGALAPDLRDVVNDRCDKCGALGKFANLPWFDTFFQNGDLKQPSTIGVLRLTAAQVNLESELLSWTVVQSKTTFDQALGVRAASRY